MATADKSLDLRRAMIAGMRSNGGLLALLPKTQMHGTKVPADPVKPFTQYGVATAFPFRSSGTNGARTVGSIHVITSSREAENQASRIAAAVAEFLDGPEGKSTILDLGGGIKARVYWTSTQQFQGGIDADDWHAVVNFEAVAL